MPVEADAKPVLGCGATPSATGTHFVLRAPDAEAVIVELFESPSSGHAARRVPLRRQGSDRWQAFVAGVGAGALYGYRIVGPYRPQDGHRFNPAKLLVDPWAKAVTGEPPLDPSLLGYRPDTGTESFDGFDSAAVVPKCVVVDDAFDWRGDAPPAIPWRDTVIYEAHVRGATISHPDVPEADRGRFLGLASPAMIDHFHRLGITALELLPVTQIASEPAVLKRGLRNYWGYSPLALMAPHADYASGGRGAQVDEFKSMVRALHAAGIEVILDIVLNHTAEGGADGPTLSWRGIANASYYRLDPRNRRRDLDMTGCGNTFDLSSPLARELALETLRYWVESMHVDGFRFDLATTLGRLGPEDGHAFSAAAPFLAAIDDDPVLSRVKRIAEPWDLGPNGYRRHQFPPGWAEWNDRFRDDVRRAWLREGDARSLARRFVARAEEAPGPEARGPSIGYVTCHDGMTLADVVAYRDKHNEANGEDNRDGNDHEIRENHGIEGPTEDRAISEARARAVRNLLATLLLADVVPMIGHGDELGRSQGGNNNAYCQDNETSWIDWRRADRQRIGFVAHLVALRRRWRNVWTTAEVEALDDTAAILRAESMAIFLNLGTETRSFALPPGAWRVVLDTAESMASSDAVERVRVEARSIRVIEREQPDPRGSG